MPTVYSDDLQKLFLEFMITEKDLFVRVRNIISPQYFSKKYFEVVELLIEYAEEYNSLPTPEQIKAKTDLDINLVPDLDESQKTWFLDEFETFCRHKALEKAIIESADLLEKSEYGTVEDKIKHAVRIGLTIFLVRTNSSLSVIINSKNSFCSSSVYSVAIFLL